ncbi:Uncharacterised protein [Salmonella enterica subsp. enterica serovar Typhimurium str. DT104]|nr:Uncharacterised protein [Salmonella enterica subsp. enterica serovar Typhimurium str. DT104]
MRLTFRKLLHVHQTQHLIDAAGNLRLRQFVLLQTKSDVLLYRHMRKQRIGLKHHINRTLIRRNMRQIDAVEHNLPAARRFKTCQHP